jgi:hypothetical protein
LVLSGSSLLADTVTVPLYPIALPTPDLVAMGIEESADKGLLSGALFLSVETDWETFFLYLGCFDIGFEMHSPLVLVIPVTFVKLEIDAPVIDFPTVIEPGSVS